ncbi:MAG: hypothetical protein IJ981_05750, partial [Clostridia bacterium]|nr:hypothetical protein [Clostridia bacterium]
LRSEFTNGAVSHLFPINGHPCDVRFIVEWCGENPPGAPVFDGLPLTDKGCVVSLRTEQYPTYFP